MISIPASIQFTVPKNSHLTREEVVVLLKALGISNTMCEWGVDGRPRLTIREGRPPDELDVAMFKLLVKNLAAELGG